MFLSLSFNLSFCNLIFDFYISSGFISSIVSPYKVTLKGDYILTDRIKTKKVAGLIRAYHSTEPKIVSLSNYPLKSAKIRG